jgi:hypothetical protein
MRERDGGNTAASRSGFESILCQVYWNFLMDSHALLCSPSFSSTFTLFKNLHTYRSAFKGAQDLTIEK